MPQISSVFWAPPFEGPLTATYEDTVEYYKAYTALAAIIHRLEEQNTGYISFRMQPGECVVFNNRRMIHGRHEFSSEGEMEMGGRHLEGCYVNIDEFMSAYQYERAMQLAKKDGRNASVATRAPAHSMNQACA